MDYLDPHFRQDFPLLSNILLGNNPKRDFSHGFSIENRHNCNYNVVGASSNPFSRVTVPAVFDNFNPFPDTDNGVYLKNNLYYQPNYVCDQYLHPYNETHGVHDMNMDFGDVVVPMNVELPGGNLGADLDKDLTKKPEQTKKIKQVRAKRKPSPNPCNTDVRQRNIIKGQWTAQEDRFLIQLVRQYGIRKWSQIAKNFNGRVGKQCRERWHNHLRPDIRKDMWSEEEDRILVAAHRVVGNKWAEIAKRLPGRTENSIKNHWNTTKRRELSKTARFGLHGAPARNPNDFISSSSYLQNYVKSVCAATPTLHMRNHLDKYSRSYGVHEGVMEDQSKVGLGDQAEYHENSMDMEVEALLHCGVKREMNLLDMFSSNGDDI